VVDTRDDQVVSVHWIKEGLQTHGVRGGALTWPCIVLGGRGLTTTPSSAAADGLTLITPHNTHRVHQTEVTENLD
jgi:hypothetical protein